MTKQWKRPESVPFPSVWKTFTGRKEINGANPKFWIQDIPEDQFETVTTIMVKHFLRDEPICKYCNLVSEPESVEQFRKLWRVVLKDKLGLICYMENPDPNGEPIIAAVNCTHSMTKGSTFPVDENSGKKYTKTLNTVEYLSHSRDCYEELGIETFLCALRLFVMPDFRGQGLGLVMLKARAVGIKGSITTFTATASQILADRAGFKDFVSITYVDLEKADPTLRYPGIQEHTNVLKYMYKIYN